MSIRETEIKTSVRPRLSADERRAAIIAAAVAEFAEKGFEGTSTEAIARRSGVSQPYVFQLFGTKRDLFIATLRQAFRRTWDAFEAAAEAVPPAERSPERLLDVMGGAYCDLLRDRHLVRCQLQAYAACFDPEIQAAVRSEFAGLYKAVATVSGADALALDHWFSWGMLFNTIVAIAPEMAADGEHLTLAALVDPEAVQPDCEPAAPQAKGTRPAKITARKSGSSSGRSK